MSGPGASAPPDERFDWVVLGGGVAGLTSALVAALEGKRVLLIERAARLGGTSARSSGTVWIPDSPPLRRQGVTGDREAARQYVTALCGAEGDPQVREAFLAGGPAMIEYLEARTDVAFRPYAAAADYRQDVPGAAKGGRPLEPFPFDGRTLGAKFDRVAWPLPELVLFGGMMVTRPEITRLMRLYRSPDAWLVGARLTLRYLWDRLRFQRGTRLVLGNALVARLYANLLRQGVTIWFETEPLRLLRDERGVTGVAVRRGGRDQHVAAALGVALAGGGFPSNAEWRRRYFPAPAAEHTPAAASAAGTTLALAQAVGAVLGTPGTDNALWFPSSIATRADGSTAVYPHIVLDRPKPGLVAVNAQGRRFVNEGVSYHEFVRAMYREHKTTPAIPAWLVCDRRFLWKYGLGMVHPLTWRQRPWIARGYLRTGRTVAALAAAIGVDAAGLEATVAAHNGFARTGVDTEFGKGGNAYDRGGGDPEHGPNPCLGPIVSPPFYAVAVVPTPLATSLGLRTDGDARVLDAGGRAIAGLYACGNDMHSPFGNEYPGAGAQLGPGMTFGYLAARHAIGAASAQAEPIPLPRGARS